MARLRCGRAASIPIPGAAHFGYNPVTAAKPQQTRMPCGCSNNVVVAR